jgi:hypothetical protein
MSFISRFVLIDVNPYVDITTGKMDAYKAAIYRVRGGNLRIAGKIKIFARHLSLFWPLLFSPGVKYLYKNGKMATPLNLTYAHNVMYI